MQWSKNRNKGQQNLKCCFANKNSSQIELNYDCQILKADQKQKPIINKNLSD